MTNESDTYAQAEPGKAPGSTFERKEMSFKTLRKRIALVAVAALAVTGLSTVPANAATNVSMWCNVADGLADADVKSDSNQAGNDACNGVAGVANTVELEFEDAPAGSRITIAGPGAIFVARSDSDLTLATNGLSGTFSATAVNNDGTLTISTPTVGTVVVSLFELVAPGIYDADASETVTITVNATASSGVVTTTNSKIQLTNSTNAAATDIDFTTANDVVAVSGLTAGTTQAGFIGVRVRDALNAAVAGSSVKAEVVSGPGVVSVATLAANATYANGGRTDSATTAATNTGTLALGTAVAGVVYVGVYADGTTGISTIRITAGTVVLGTVTVTFYGNVTTVAATQAMSIADASGAVNLGTAGSATAAAVYVKLTDANNNPVVAAVTATPADTTVISGGTCTAVVPGTYGCDIDPAANTSGKSTTVVFSAVGASSAVIKSAPITFTLGGVTPASVALSFDKAAYAPGAPVVLSITAKDAAGNPVADGLKDNLTAAAGLAFNYATGVATTENEIDDLVFLKGVATVKTFAPLSGGSISASGTLGTGVATAAIGSAISATASVTDTAVALQAQMASIIAAIAKLQKAIAKINKRLKR